MRISGLRGTWGSFRLRGIDLELEDGEYFLIVGPSGSGKTLLLETIAGLHRAEAGRLWFGEEELTNLPPERRKIGFVYQERCLFPHLSVPENIGYGLRYTGMGRQQAEARVAEMVALFGLEELAKRGSIAGLSGGEMQKVALARALAVEPRMLFLDEPLGALDYTSRTQVADILKDVNRRFGITTVHVTHDYTEAMALADRIGVMHNGALEQVGTVEEVFWRPKNRFVAEFLGVDNVLEARSVPGKDGRVVEAAGLQIEVARAPQAECFYLCIRPEDVILALEPMEGANVFRGEITALAQQGFQARVTVAVGTLELVARVPLSSVREANLTVSSPVYVGLAPESLHGMEDGEEA